MKLTRIAVLVAVGALATAGCAKSDDASASDFPSDDIRMIVTYAAGGPTDLAGRAIAKSYEEKFGVSVVVENVDGGSGAVGTAQLSAAKPDGLTIAMTTASAASRVPLIEDVGYTLDDLAPIGVGTVGPGMLFVPADSPYQTAEEFFEAAKKSPGKITVGTAGAQAPQHVEFERMKSEYGIELNLVPFKGEAPAVNALLGGNVDAVFGSNAEVSLAQVEAGKTKTLAVGSTERLDYAPDAPTLVELGYDKLTYGNSMFILVAPDGTPDEVVATLEEGLQEALADPEIAKVIGEERVPTEFIGAKAISDQMHTEVSDLEPILTELFG
ncbi:Bug family tripartite tricarboxylate transporter substrate binding protein [Mumia sp. DW29H23]|uniref:Bug family tripartite tricarboxylate transporter substrate binding protein n=1 Tax=Mumia sp. DW29H23 TaxID=3421241 RepID=UPI003D6928CF